MQEQIHPERALEHKRLLHLQGGIGFSALVPPKRQQTISVDILCKDGNPVTNLSQCRAAHF